MNKTKWSKLRSPHGAYKPFRCRQGTNRYSQKRPLLYCCGEEPVFPGRMQGHSVVKVPTDRRSGDKHTEVIHCYRWNGLLSQIIDDKYLTRRNGETKPGEAKGEKSKGKKKKKERETDKNSWFLDQAKSRTRSLKSELSGSSQSRPTHSCCIKFQN